MKIIMTRKTKLSIFVFAGIVALATVAGIIMLDEQTMTTQEDKTNTVLLKESVPPPVSPVYERIILTGVPMLTSYQLSDKHPSDNKVYHQVNKETHQFVLDAIDNGISLLTIEDRISFYENYNNKDARNLFEATNSDGSSTYYRVSYSEPKLHVTSHYVKLFVYAESDPYTISNAKAVSSLDSSKFESQLEDAYVWLEVDDATARDIKSIMSDNGKTLQLGNVKADAYYFGPLSDDLQRTDIHNMYADKLGVDKIE